MLLIADDIVTDMDRNSLFYGKQGRVVRTQLRFWGGPEVTVHFDRDLYPCHLRHDEHLDGFYFVYSPRLLRRDADWKPEVYARRLFGDRWHNVRMMKDPLNPQSLCLVEGCDNAQAKMIWFNIWGSVCNVYVCLEHAKQYHRMCADSFPWRKELAA